MFACEVCLLECLDPIYTPETSLFVVVLQELRLSGHIAQPADQTCKIRKRIDHIIKYIGVCVCVYNNQKRIGIVV